MRVSEAIRRCVELMRASDEYWQRELRKRHPRYPVVSDDEGSVPPPPEDAELAQLLRALPADDVYTILAVVSVGYRYFQAAALGAARDKAKQEYATAEEAIAWVVERTFAWVDLADGFDAVLAAGIDLDSPHPVPA